MKPHEAAILFAYSQGYTNPKDIAKLFNYKTKRPVEKVLAEHKDNLPDLIKKSHGTRNIGRGFYSPS